MQMVRALRRAVSAAASYFERHPAAGAFALTLFLQLAVESLCRRSVSGGVRFFWDAPLQFAYGMGIVLLTVSLTGLVRRRRFAVLLVSLVWLGLGIVDCVLGSFRVTPLTAVDFQLIFSVLSILSIYLNPFEVVLAVLAVLAALGLLVLAFLRSPKRQVDYVRAGMGCAAAALFVWGSTALFAATGLLPKQLENLPDAYDQYGFVYCFTTGLFDRGIREPEDYSPQDVDLVVEELSPPPAAAEPQRPNIVVVQLESFFDVNYLQGVTYSENPVPVFTRLKGACSSGFLTVPSLGGGTANSEFEVISGMSLDYFGTGEYPYETVLQSNVCESYGYILRNAGYRTHAIHNHMGTFYDRDQVYANLGFDTFTPVEYMEHVPRNALGWAEDAVLTEEILLALDESDAPDFVYTVSVQAHGKYPTEVIDSGQTITARGMDEVVLPKAGFEYYLNQLHASDAFLDELIRALSARPEPTVLVAFGDHLPNFDIPQEALSAGGLLQTEYVIWSNCGLERKDGDLEAYQLLSEVLDRLGYHEGVLNRLHQERQGNAAYQKDLEMLEYDILYGQQYAYDGHLPFEPTALQMGVLPITVQWADNLHDEIYVTGKHFTEASRITINGHVQNGTVRINPTTLMLPGEVLENLDVVSVSQVTRDGEVLSSSNQFTYVE